MSLGPSLCETLGHSWVCHLTVNRCWRCGVTQADDAGSGS